MAEIGLIFPPDQPPEHLLPVARAVDASTLDELWVWEDCFAHTGLSTASVALASTDRVRVGIGLMPVPLRNVALLAMEIATIARLFPGRLLPTIGHGVQDWMRQTGVKLASPLTLLREQAVALRALLAGEEVTVSGDYVRLDRVRLQWPPQEPLPLYVGGEGPKTLALAGEVGDGVLFTGGTRDDALLEGMRIATGARTAAGVGGGLECLTFMAVRHGADVDAVTAKVGRLVEAGADRVAAYVLSPDGPPASDLEALLAAVEMLEEVRHQLR
ncbi:LLM class flavin-dependent oxidoreductase [Ornithinimicrobium panacihumi]|uniref:LLM class flavin-dependent oxidoreductase n=1 Tax=Ornithinimicrobium panacihumi TaxID=2008449 RepID=UPI003F8C5A67